MADKGVDPTRIMVAVNESNLERYPHPSASCKEAFDWTIKKIIRSNTSGFRVLLLHVKVPYDDDDGFDDVECKYPSPEDTESAINLEMLMSLKLLGYFVKQCHKIGVTCEAWIKKGDPRKIICSEVKRVQPDFLVVGSRGLSFLQRIFLANVSEYCAKHADCPVIVIKRSPSQAPDELCVVFD